jgi:hypothetical protein
MDNLFIENILYNAVAITFDVESLNSQNFQADYNSFVCSSFLSSS